MSVMATATADQAAPARTERERRRELSPAERAAKGKRARSDVPRKAQALWEPPPDRRDPVEILREQEATRVPELLPIRHERMGESAFSFYRGAAAVMAADLALMPSSGLRVQLCGDAHLSNFGGFAAPDRSLVFDINDFDETLPGPFEWDVKRLAASVEIAGRDCGFGARDRGAAVSATTGRYREAMHSFADARAIDVWYARLDERNVLPALEAVGARGEEKRLNRAARKARSKDSMRALSRLTEDVDGSLRIIDDPPLIVPVGKLFEDISGRNFEREMRENLNAYRRSVTGAGARLIDRYRYVDMARKVVGVGSVGTRACIILMLGRDADDPLFLQVKEADASVLEPYAGKSRFSQHGRRVVEGQWLMQSASDVLLGWASATGVDGQRRDFYVRQLWDWKRSADIETMTPERLHSYGQMCGWTLARAHARSGDPIAIASYLGGSDRFDRAMADFAVAYADQNERDYSAFRDAVASGAPASRR